MGEKDISEKMLESYNDVFADIINTLLFNGNFLIKEDELEEDKTHSAYKADNKLHAIERDIAKYWRKGLLRIAEFGAESQTEVDKDMPLRLFGYDGTAYRAQLLADKTNTDKKPEITKEKQFRYPVVTVVLYFGYKRHWKKPLTLYDCLKIPNELKPFVNDYKMNLYEIAYLSDEQVKLFKSDFRIVADYFVQMRKNNNYVLTQETIEHVHELLQLMSVLTNDTRFEEVYSSDMEERKVNMCEILDKVENRGIAIGIEQGIAASIKNLMNNLKLTKEQAMNVLNVPESEQDKYKELLLKMEEN